MTPNTRPPTPLTRADPHLMTLRTVIDQAHGEAMRGPPLDRVLAVARTADMAKARLRLYDAIRTGDGVQAEAWLNALEVGVLGYNGPHGSTHNLSTITLAALRGLRAVVEGMKGSEGESS